MAFEFRGGSDFNFYTYSLVQAVTPIKQLIMAALTWMLVSSFFALLYWWFFVATKHPKGFPKGPGFSLPFLGNALVNNFFK